MKHPFDDFLPPSIHVQREGRRVVRIGIVLVAVVSIATAAAFASTLISWRDLLTSRSSVSMRWDDASIRVVAFVKAQRRMQDAIESAKEIERFIDSVPRSVILWELTRCLPENSVLNDIRLETRKRHDNEGEEKRTQQIDVLGIAPNDAAISAYIEVLSTSAYFKSASLVYAQQDGNSTRRNFSLQLLVNTKATLSMETDS